MAIILGGQSAGEKACVQAEMTPPAHSTLRISLSSVKKFKAAVYPVRKKDPRPP